MPRPVLAAALSLGLLLVPAGCDEEEPSDDKPVPPSPSEPVPVAPRAVAAPGAFDLTAAQDGAVLVWAVPHRDGGGLRALALDPEAIPRGEAREVIPRDAPGGGGSAGDLPAMAVEVAAATGGDRLAVAWVLRWSDGRMRAYAARADAGATTFGPPAEIGPVPDAVKGARGRLAVAVSDAGTVDVLHRAPDGPCEGEATGTGCARYRHWQPGGARRGLPLVVPEPCEPPVIGSLFRGGRWYFGLCARRDGERATTVYGIQFEPEYAHAERVLSGCAPVGMAPAQSGVVVTGRCGDRLAASVLREAGKERRDLESARLRARCEDGRPVLEMGPAGAGDRLVLSAPLAGLGARLAEAVGGPEARAAWTGRALLVAVPLDREVAVRRYRCADGSLVRSDVL